MTTDEVAVFEALYDLSYIGQISSCLYYSNCQELTVVEAKDISEATYGTETIDHGGFEEDEDWSVVKEKRTGIIVFRRVDPSIIVQ